MHQYYTFQSANSRFENSNWTNVKSCEIWNVFETKFEIIQMWNLELIFSWKHFAFRTFKLKNLETEVKFMPEVNSFWTLKNHFEYTRIFSRFDWNVYSRIEQISFWNRKEATLRRPQNWKLLSDCSKSSGKQGKHRVRHCKNRTWVQIVQKRSNCKKNWQ